MYALPIWEIDGRQHAVAQQQPNREQSTSVLCHFSFHGFLHSGNRQKPVETKKRGNLETYVRFPRNLLQGQFRNYKNGIIFDLNFLSRFPETKKPAETSGNLETKMTKYWCTYSSKLTPYVSREKPSCCCLILSTFHWCSFLFSVQMTEWKGWMES